MFFRLFIGFLAILSLNFPTIANAAVPEWIHDLSRNEILDTAKPEDQSEIACLALVVYYEARGESIRGQRAVAEVVMNRTRSPKYPSTVCQVMFQHRQFSFINRTKVLSPRKDSSWTRALDIAKQVFHEPTSIGWLSFCNCRKSGYRIGNHVFYGR